MLKIQTLLIILILNISTDFLSQNPVYSQLEKPAERHPCTSEDRWKGQRPSVSSRMGAESKRDEPTGKKHGEKNVAFV